MKKLIGLTCGILLLGTCVGAQAQKTQTSSHANAPKVIHLTGLKAFQLISLLASGSEAVDNTIRNARSHKSEFIVHEFQNMTGSTYKYDEDDPNHKLAIYSASGKVGSATESTTIGEATSIFKLLAAAGVPGDLALEGSYLEAKTIDCKIDATASFKAIKRFQCDITIGF